MRKATKTIISFAVVLIAGLNLIVPAFAQDPFTAVAVGGLTGASGAGLFGSMAGMSGVNIGWSSDGSDTMDAMWNNLNSEHVYFSGEKHEANPAQDPEDIYDYIEVDIGDWLNAQSEFITKFIRENNVTSNSSGTTSTGQRIGPYPVVGEYNGYFYTDYFPIQFNERIQFDTFYIKYFHSNNLNANLIGLFENGQTSTSLYTNVYQSTATGYIRFYSNNNNKTVSMALTYNPISMGNKYYLPANTNIYYIGSSIINWTSDTVNSSVFDGWETAKVKIPHDMSQLATGWTLTDFLNELDRIWTGAGEDNIIIEDGGYVPPVPPSPIPDTPLGNVPFDDWIDLWGQGIYQQLENQSDTLDLIGSNGIDQIEELESIDSNLDDLNNTAESIDTNIGVGNGILGGIRSLAQQALNTLSGIAENVAELVESVVQATETLIAGILNQIPALFGVIFDPIKRAGSIWHYVVEWIQSITSPMSWIWSMASGTSYYIVLPVYASLAGAVVLAFYKRFGK